MDKTTSDFGASASKPMPKGTPTKTQTPFANIVNSGGSTGNPNLTAFENINNTQRPTAPTTPTTIVPTVGKTGQTTEQIITGMTTPPKTIGNNISPFTGKMAKGYYETPTKTSTPAPTKTPQAKPINNKKIDDIAKDVVKDIAQIPTPPPLPIQESSKNTTQDISSPTNPTSPSTPAEAAPAGSGGMNWGKFLGDLANGMSPLTGREGASHEADMAQQSQDAAMKMSQFDNKAKENLAAAQRGLEVDQANLDREFKGRENAFDRILQRDLAKMSDDEKRAYMNQKFQQGQGEPKDDNDALVRYIMQGAADQNVGTTGKTADQISRGAVQ